MTGEGAVWRWETLAAELTELENAVDASLAAPESADSSAGREVGAVSTDMLRRRNRLRDLLAEEERVLRNGLAQAAHCLNSLGSLPTALARAMDVLTELFAPHPVLLVPEGDWRQRCGTLAVSIDDGWTGAHRLVIEGTEAFDGDSTARRYLDALGSILTMGLRARATEQATEDRIRQLQSDWAELMEQLQPGGPVLTPRERQVLALVRDGHSNSAIARELYVSVETVKSHVRSLLGKYGVSRRTAFVPFGPKE